MLQLWLFIVWNFTLHEYNIYFCKKNSFNMKYFISKRVVRNISFILIFALPQPKAHWFRINCTSKNFDVVNINRISKCNCILMKVIHLICIVDSVSWLSYKITVNPPLQSYYVPFLTLSILALISAKLKIHSFVFNFHVALIFFVHIEISIRKRKGIAGFQHITMSDESSVLIVGKYFNINSLESIALSLSLSHSHYDSRAFKMQTKDRFFPICCYFVIS